MTVDVSKRRPINEHIYGVNIANWAPTYYLDLITPYLKKAKVSVVRLGATNMERYNYQSNRMYNVITRQNQYVHISWESFIAWTREELNAEPFLQASVYGHVAGEGSGIGEPEYDHVQDIAEVADWVTQTEGAVLFWGIGNEPWIAWKRSDYPSIYRDAAHGDQVLNQHISYDVYFDRFTATASAIKSANPEALIFGPTSANWWLYWQNDFSPFAPVTEANGSADLDNDGWDIMSAPESTWDRTVFPDRGDDPDITGWEEDPNRIVSQYALRMKTYEDDFGVRVADYLDVHRYINAFSDRDVLQEIGGLWDEDFVSWGDQEIFPAGIQPKILKRLQNVVDLSYPGTFLSFSEYDLFYRNGHPKIPQIAAVAQMDYLGVFAKMGVQLACNWYVGEPNQSGIGLDTPSESTKQAMFGENGEPKPKYWAFWLMSNFFRDRGVEAHTSDWGKFASDASLTPEHEIQSFAVYKGEYDSFGAFIPDQQAEIAEIRILNQSNLDSSPLKMVKILRFGMDDPFVVEIEPQGTDITSGTFSYVFEPLAIYLFVLSPAKQPSPPDNHLHVNPQTIDFGAYETGAITEDDVVTHTVPITITNTRQGSTTWTINENTSWLNIAGNTAGEAKVTDVTFLTVERSGLPYGVYNSEVTVETSEGTVIVPVSMEVVPGEANGEKRIADFETGSLAHTWNEREPYSLGWWDGHGQPVDRNAPYLYVFSLNHQETSRLGGQASMQILFDRTNGDTENSKQFFPFGTFGHTSVTSEGTFRANADWLDYHSFQFDIKPDTENENHTELLVVITDESGKIGKPITGIQDHFDLMTLEDGKWQTVTIDLSKLFFDWRFPNGQTGQSIKLDFSRIKQIEFTPWSGSSDKKGVIYLDNLRVVKADKDGNRFPIAVAKQRKTSVGIDKPVSFNASMSSDPDGAVASYRWEPTTGLSDPNVPNPVFVSN
ncbi:MAG: glycoside hydrolase family 44 protein, partial [Candidatus Anammoxibacter sp.]